MHPRLHKRPEFIGKRPGKEPLLAPVDTRGESVTRTTCNCNYGGNTVINVSHPRIRVMHV